MAFYNSFLNFNSFTPMFNFGCFNMPNFFSGFTMPFGFNNIGFNSFGINNFSFFNNPFQMPFPQTTQLSLNSNQSSVFAGFTNNGWQNLSSPIQPLDTFARTSTTSSTVAPNQFDWASSMNFTAATTVSTKTSGKKKTGGTVAYSSTTDVNAAQNAKFIKNLTSEMQEKTKKLIAYANKNGYDVQIIDGYRTQAEQKELQNKYKDEPGRVAKNSAHCAGKAIDIKVTKNGQDSDAGYKLLGNYAKSQLGMRWGGDFSSYRERWHFDYDWA